MGNIANISEHPEVLLLFSFIFKFGFYFISKNILGLGADYLLEFCNRVLLV